MELLPLLSMLRQLAPKHALRLNNTESSTLITHRQNHLEMNIILPTQRDDEAEAES